MEKRKWRLRLFHPAGPDGEEQQKKWTVVGKHDESEGDSVSGSFQTEIQLKPKLLWSDDSVELLRGEVALVRSDFSPTSCTVHVVHNTNPV